MTDRLIGGIDVGGTRTAAAVAGREGIVATARAPTPLAGEPSAVATGAMELLARCCDETGCGVGALEAVGVSCPGPFRRAGGMVELVAPNMCGALAPARGVLPNDWSAISLEWDLRAALPGTRLVVDNDAVAGAVAEGKLGAGRGRDDFVYVTWSTGVGTGAFVDGRLIRGKDGNAPHGGHVNVSGGPEAVGRWGDGNASREEHHGPGEDDCSPRDDGGGLREEDDGSRDDGDGPLCGCGGRGHLEAAASGTAIAREYRALAGDALPSGATDPEAAAAAFAAFRRGDGAGVRVVRQAASAMARGLGSINAVLDTSLIIIGGGVFVPNADVLLPLLREEFSRTMPIMTGGVEIMASPLREHLGLLAALALVLPGDAAREWAKRRPWEDGGQNGGPGFQSPDCLPSSGPPEGSKTLPAGGRPHRELGARREEGESGR